MISYEMDLPLKEIRKYISHYKKRLKIRSHVNKKYLSKKRKLQKNHLEFIENLIKSQKGNPLTINDVRLRLKEEFNEVSTVSKSTVRRGMKGDLKMSYTKVSKVNPSLFKATSKIKMLKWSWVIEKLIERRINVIFVDEFSVSARSFKTFTWSPVGSKSLYSNRADSFSFSFIVGLSSKMYYGVNGTNGTF